MLIKLHIELELYRKELLTSSQCADCTKHYIKVYSNQISSYLILHLNANVFHDVDY